MLKNSKTLLATVFLSSVGAPLAFADDAATDGPQPPKAACPYQTEEAKCEVPPPAPPPMTHTSPQYAPPPEAMPVEEHKVDPFSYAWYDPRLSSGIGVELQLGGGVGGFTDSSVNNLSSSQVGGIWNFRTTIGSHTPLGLELAYNGTAYDLQSFDGTTSDTLIGTNFEGALRWNILPHYVVNPYIFAGAGWQHYDLNNNTLNRADAGIGSSDDSAVFPMGVGLSYRDPSGVTAQLRGTFRASQSSTFITDANGNDLSLHTWDATAGLGYEF